MAAADLATTNGHDVTDAEARNKARQVVRAADAAGEPITGADLGEAFGKTDRWGRKQIEAARSAHRPTGVPAGTRQATAPPARRNDLPPADEPHAPTAAIRLGVPAAPAATADRSVAVPAGAEVASDRVRVVIRWVTTLAVIVVAACAARASYDHQRHVVEMAGEDQAAWYLPLSVDGMMLVASLNMLVRRWDNQPAGRLTWAALILGGIASLAANVAAAEPTLIGRLVAAWPPACLIVSYELLMQQLPARGASADDRQ